MGDCNFQLGVCSFRSGDPQLLNWGFWFLTRGFVVSESGCLVSETVVFRFGMEAGKFLFPKRVSLVSEAGSF